MFLALGAGPRLVLLLLPLGEAEEALQRTTQEAVLTGVRLIADFAGALVSELDINQINGGLHAPVKEHQDTMGRRRK